MIFMIYGLINFSNSKDNVKNIKNCILGKNGSNKFFNCFKKFIAICIHVIAIRQLAEKQTTKKVDCRLPAGRQASLIRSRGGFLAMTKKLINIRFSYILRRKIWIFVTIGAKNRLLRRFFIKFYTIPYTLGNT